MKMKQIAALLVFFTTFGFSATVAQLFETQTPATQNVQLRADSSARRRILKLLDQDINNGNKRFRQLNQSKFAAFSSEWIAAQADAVGDYADQSGSMNDANLPAEFQSAWREHMQAWREHANYLRDAEDENLDSDELYENLVAQSSEINRTWDEVLSIAADYDAFPKNAR